MAIFMPRAVSRLLTAGMTALYSALSPLTISTSPPSILTVFSIPDTHPAASTMQGASFCTKYTKNDAQETLESQTMLTWLQNGGIIRSYKLKAALSIH
jgi:hypothetical protein